MLQDLQWPSLQSRREAAIKTMLFKISHNLIAINKDQYLTPLTDTRLRKLPSSKISVPHYSLNQGHLQIFIYANCGQTLEHPPCRRHHNSVSGRLQGTHLYQLAPGESFLVLHLYIAAWQSSCFTCTLSFFLNVNIQKWTLLSTDVDVDVGSVDDCWILLPLFSLIS